MGTNGETPEMRDPSTMTDSEKLDEILTLLRSLALAAQQFTNKMAANPMLKAFME